MALDLGHGAYDFRGSGRVSDAPAGHRVGFGNAIDDDGLFLDVVPERGKADKLEIVVDQLSIDLVGDDEDVFLANDLGQGFELAFLA